MPSHIHLIISGEDVSLSGIMRDFKKMTNKKMIECLNEINESRREWLLRGFRGAGKNLKRITNYKVWQDGNHPVELSDNNMLTQRLDYIHNNPVESEIVDEPKNYWYSSARDYGGVKGLLNVKLLD